MSGEIADKTALTAGVRRRLILLLLLAALTIAAPLPSGQSSATEVASRETIERVVIARVAAFFDVSPEQVSPETDFFAVFLADPMDVVEIVGRLCDRFDVALPDGEELRTVAEIVDHLQEALVLKSLAEALEEEEEEDSEPIFRGGDKIPPQSAPEEPDEAAGEKDPATGFYRQTFFFVTNRAETDETDLNERYGGARNAENSVTYGLGAVSIPIAVHKPGRIERPTWWKLEFSENPKKHIALLSLDPVTHDDFFAQVDGFGEGRGEAGREDILVFIHGFNTTFDSAARRTAQIAYDLDFPGAPILFSWPSDGNGKAYLADREDATWSVQHMEAFLGDLEAMGDDKRIHLIAHSMGNQVLIQALHTIALRRGETPQALFENVILAAPDFDAGAFVDRVGQDIRSLATRWTIYESDKDLALSASEFLSVPRLGQPVVALEGMDAVDASGVDVTPWIVPEFHSYYATKKRVIADLIAVLKGLGPRERALEQATLDGIPYWILK